MPPPHGTTHSVEIPDAVQISGTKLNAGNYKGEWQGTDSTVQVSFQQNGRSVVTAPGKLKTNNDRVTQDAIGSEATAAGTSTLKEIDFGRQKEAQFLTTTQAVCSGRNAVWVSIYNCGLRELRSESWELLRTQALRESVRLLVEYSCFGRTPLEMADLQMVESVVEWMRGLLLTAPTLLIGSCIVGSIIAALRDLSGGR